VEKDWQLLILYFLALVACGNARISRIALVRVTSAQDVEIA
jgi:hypothetical protein